jgi:hypothetical protein
VKQASLQELRSLPWLPDRVAAAVYDRFHPSSGLLPSAVGPDGVRPHSGDGPHPDGSA